MLQHMSVSWKQCFLLSHTLTLLFTSNNGEFNDIRMKRPPNWTPVNCGATKSWRNVDGVSTLAFPYTDIYVW